MYISKFSRFVLGISAGMLLMLLITGTGLLSTSKQSTSITAAPFENKHVDVSNKFSVYFPSGVLPLDATKQFPTIGYLPVCGNAKTTLACFVIPGNTFPNTNFGEASASVGIRTDKTDATNCEMREDSNGEFATNETTKIAGIEFKKFATSDAGAGHRSSGFVYRGFINNKCYELSTRVNTTAFENYEPGMIQKFTDQNEKDVRATLEKIISTFTL
ncbi:MAG: hypothetical protein NT003_02710 [Candidatus Magasanikbacteria bacterium]|nr:hypothetical protein [Candidatus Magasanikbacteria bacterium]